jgi:hypothetical protein
MKLRMTSHDRMLTWRGWALRGLLAPVALAGLLIVGGVCMNVEYLVRRTVLFAVLFVLALLGLLAIDDCRRAAHWWVAAWYGAYIGLLTFVYIPIVSDVQVSIQDRDLPNLVLAPLWVACYALGYVLVWRIIQGAYGPIVVQDGTLCPNCSYSLLGTPNRRCPECGREFTYEELGTAEELFRLRQKTQDRIARPLDTWEE